MNKTSMLLATAALLLALPCSAQQTDKGWKLTEGRKLAVSSRAFLESHPDMYNRMWAMDALKRGDLARAAHFFRLSARYADKTSQAAYAEMLWEGRGVPRDRALAYAWMDLAAEREDSPLVRFRERYWAGLDDAERKRALELGPQVYAEYGDDVAKRRLETVLRRGKRGQTGSRTGMAGGLKIFIPGPGEGTYISGTEFYDRRFWEPEQYWAWQGKMMKGLEDELKEGRVIVGDLHREPDAKSGDTKPAETPNPGEP